MSVPFEPGLLRRYACGAFALLACSSAQATPTGTLGIADVVGGSINISATRIDFAPPADPAAGSPGSGDFATSGVTTITWSGGVLTSSVNPYGTIKDFDVGAPVVDLIRFYVSSGLPTPPGTGSLSTFPAFDLAGLAPGGAAQGALNNCAGVTAVGVSCSPLIGGQSPFVHPMVLTNRGAFTTVTIAMLLTGKDATGNTSWTGGLTTRVMSSNGTRLTPDAIQTMLNSGSTISGTYSAVFSAPPPIP